MFLRQPRHGNIIPWVTAPTIPHAPREVSGAEEALACQGYGCGHCINIGVGEAVTQLHDCVCVRHLHANEGIVGHLDELCILHRSLKHGGVVDGLKKLPHKESRIRVVRAQQDELWGRYVVVHRAHGDKKLQGKRGGVR